MADNLNLFPIPVTFVDGQQPSAAFLNAFTDQVDNAFQVLGGLIGDYYGENSDHNAYITTFVRALGSMGLINTRLPRDVVARDAGGADDLSATIIREDLDTNFTGEKEAIITFQTSAIQATEAGVNSSLGTPRASGANNPYEGMILNDLGDWALDGRRVVTDLVIGDGAWIEYPLITTADDYYDAYAPDSGANVVPSIYDIADGSKPFCDIEAFPGGDADIDFQLNFPVIRKVQNPSAPFSQGEVIDLTDNTGDVYWKEMDGAEGQNESLLPTYVVPPYIVGLADQGTNLIPSGLVSLWIKDGTSIQQVRPAVDGDEISFYTIDTNRRAIKMVIPPSLVDQLPHQGNINLTNQYIVVFAGTSVAEALQHERSRMLHHRHDGHADDWPVSAKYLLDRFDPAIWRHSHATYNHFPQYLDRSGYWSANEDDPNRNNAMLGNLHMGPTTATPANIVLAEDNTEDSYKISFADPASGPLIWFDSTDGKLQIDNDEIRATLGDVSLGATNETSGRLLWGAANERLSLSSVDVGGQGTFDGTTFRTGVLTATSGKIVFVNDLVSNNPSTLRYRGLVGGLATWELERQGAISNTQLKVGRLVADSITSRWDGPSTLFIPAEAFTAESGTLLIDTNIALGYWTGAALDLRVILNPFMSQCTIDPILSDISIDRIHFIIKRNEAVDDDSTITTRLTKGTLGTMVDLNVNGAKNVIYHDQRKIFSVTGANNADFTEFAMEDGAGSITSYVEENFDNEFRYVLILQTNILGASNADFGGVVLEYSLVSDL